MKNTLLILAILSFNLMGCATTKNTERLEAVNPVWISGIQGPKTLSTEFLPRAEENEFLKVIKAGFWLVNIKGQKAQLVYVLKLENKKAFPQSKVYTKAVFDNPENLSQPIIYQGTLDNVFSTTKITHINIKNVKMKNTYHLRFEAYADQERTNLITKIDQLIQADVDNTSDCVIFSIKANNTSIGMLINKHGKIVPFNKINNECH